MSRSGAFRPAISTPSIRRNSPRSGAGSGAERRQAQRDYAASDVRFLHAMKVILDMRLAREGRTALAQACFDFLPTRAALDLAGWPETDIFAHS